MESAVLPPLGALPPLTLPPFIFKPDAEVTRALYPAAEVLQCPAVVQGNPKPTLKTLWLYMNCEAH